MVILSIPAQSSTVEKAVIMFILSLSSWKTRLRLMSKPSSCKGGATTKLRNLAGFDETCKL